MAADVALLATARAEGAAYLRIYRFGAPTLTLGRFQPESDVDFDAAARLGVEVVRRPTGGRALLHGREVTYAVALERPAGPEGSVHAFYAYLAGALIHALRQLGVESAVARLRTGTTTPACFTGVEGADLRVGTRKVCGSAQLQRDGWVLQHGSVLLDRLPFDESDLLRFPDAATRLEVRRMLGERTVTLRELGVVAPARTVADALIGGFATI